MIIKIIDFTYRPSCSACPAGIHFVYFMLTKPWYLSHSAPWDWDSCSDLTSVLDIAHFYQPADDGPTT